VRKAIFLDRDGTLIEAVPYLSRLSQIKLLSGVPEALSLLKGKGYSLVVITNQSGVARGFFDEDFVLESHRRIQLLLKETGVTVDAFYFCPHHPTEGDLPYRVDCDCRKPKPGLLLRAASELGLGLVGSWVVGDDLPDLMMARNLELPFVLLRSGYGRMLEEGGLLPSLREREWVVDDLLAAARLIADKSSG
jgi:D-glycero-D-manno-heptose 1,7-bisphosphate phosphatase